MRTELSESKRGRNFPEQCDNINMLYPALGVRIVLAPKANKLIQVVRAQDGPISRQIVEVVHDDSDEQIENEEGANDEKGDEVGISKVRSAPGRIAGVLGSLVTDDLRVFLAGQHDFLPSFASG